MLDISVGPVRIRFTTDSPTRRGWPAIEREFGPAAIRATASPPELLVRFGRNSAGFLDFPALRFAGHMAFSETQYRHRENPFEYLATNVFRPGPTELRITVPSSNRRGGAHSAAIWVRQRLSGPPPETGNPVTSYALLWYVAALALQKAGGAFVHAGIVERAGEATILAGTGGSGKTSLTLAMMEVAGTRFLAEDFGILNGNGCASFSPKAMTIYASDVRHGQSDLVRYVGSRPRMERRYWEIAQRRGQNPRRKVPPAELFDAPRIGSEAPVGRAYFLIRSAVSTVTVRQVPAADFARHATAASFRELKALHEVTHQARAIGIPFPHVHDLERRHESILVDALKHTATYLAEIPRHSGPDSVMRLIG